MSGSMAARRGCRPSPAPTAKSRRFRFLLVAASAITHVGCATRSRGATAPTPADTPIIAIVTAPYDFWVNDRFSHCGTDVFTLVEQDGRWRIASIAYTIQRRDCAPSPLGPPVFRVAST